MQMGSILLVAGILQLFSPFWIIGLVACMAGIVFSERPRKWTFGRKKRRSSYSFLAGFLAIFLLWVVMAFWIDSGNDSVLSIRIADMLLQSEEGLSDGLKPYVLIFLTGTLGGLFAGSACMMGNYLGEMIKG